MRAQGRRGLIVPFLTFFFPSRNSGTFFSSFPGAPLGEEKKNFHRFFSAIPSRPTLEGKLAHPPSFPTTFLSFFEPTRIKGKEASSPV